jgi:hypothetical protein
VRLVVGIVLLLAGAVSLSCRFDGLAVELPPSHERIEWVRTVHGWERPDAWLPEEVPALQLHPLVVASGQAMLSVLALAAFAGNSHRRRSSAPASV